MQKLKDIIQKYYEGLAYLFFGGVATLLNLVVFAGFQAAFGTDFAAGIGNILDNCICILFAYWTNRTFVFKSANKGKAAWAEFGQFVSCRVATMVMDQVIIWLGVSCWGRMSRLPRPTASCGPWASSCSARSSLSCPTTFSANCLSLKRSNASSGGVYMLILMAKFVLKHPLLTHGARQLVHKNYAPQKEASL